MRFPSVTRVSPCDERYSHVDLTKAGQGRGAAVIVAAEVTGGAASIPVSGFVCF